MNLKFKLMHPAMFCLALISLSACDELLEQDTQTGVERDETAQTSESESCDSAACPTMDCAAGWQARADAEGCCETCEPTHLSSCSAIRCAPGYLCVEDEDGAASCVEQSDDEDAELRIRCDQLACQPGYHCVEDDNGNGRCIAEDSDDDGTSNGGVDCARIRCASGFVCVEGPGLGKEDASCVAQ